MIKDLILLLVLMNILIGYLQKLPVTVQTAHAAVVEVEQYEDLKSSVQAHQEANNEASGELGAVVAKVYTLESSNGKNDSCKESGKFNGYGYAQNLTTWNCFDSHEEVTNKVKSWFEKHLKTKTLGEALCGYNLGFQSEHFQKCVQQDPEYPYYKNFLSLN